VTAPVVMRPARRRLLQLLPAAALAAAGVALAQDFPKRTLTMIVPFPAGGSADALARIIAKGLGDAAGRQVVVDNRPGAGGRVGTAIAARSNPDGHTLLLGTVSAFSIEPALRQKVDYDPLKDFTPIAPAAEMPFILVVPGDSPYRSVDELVAAARAGAGTLNYASWGLGTSCHLITEMFAASRGVSLTHVPYKGAVNAVTDVAASRVALMFALPFDAMPHITSGRLRALAVTGAQRMSALPQVPTLPQLGIRGVDMNAWFGLFVPARTPQPAVSRLRALVEPVLSSATLRGWIQAQGAIAFPGGPDELTRRIRADSDATAAIAKSLSLRLED